MRLACVAATVLLAACADPLPGDEPGADPADDTADPWANEDHDSYAAFEDCNDLDANVNPGAIEVCNGIDDDCDEETDENVTNTYWADGDDDGYGDVALPVESCSQLSGTATNANDCDDDDPTAFPGNDEICDGIDNDCNGEVDDGLGILTYPDEDGDGYGDEAAGGESCDPPGDRIERGGGCDDGDAGVNPEATESCDGVDNDCDGETDEAGAAGEQRWYLDGDGDGYGQAGAETAACDRPSGFVDDASDCDDADPGVRPGAEETCDGEDDDCDGSTDEDDASDASRWYLDADGDGYGDATGTRVSCEQPTGYAGNDLDCDDADATTNPDAVEACDSIDNNCDGASDDDDTDVTGRSTWWADGDLDGYGDSLVTVEACVAPSGYVEPGVEDCDDADEGVYPGATELCDGADQDCDGAADDGVLGTGAACPAEDCAKILDDDPTVADGSYHLDAGTYDCDMTTDGGGWTLVENNAPVYGTTFDSSFYNTEGFTWNEVLLLYVSGSTSGYCDYPDDLPDCNNLGVQFGPGPWAVLLNGAGDTCGMSTIDYSWATTYLSSTDFSVSRTDSTDTIRVGTLDGVAGCSTSDNSGAAFVDVYVRR